MAKINVTRSSMPPFEEYMEEIRSIWDTRWLTNAGEKHQRLEAELKERLNVSNVNLFCNGHLALEAAFNQFEPGGEVITTPFTYVSTTLAIVRAGLTPVFCDIEPTWYTLDPAKIEPLITEKTVAIAPVHVYGNMCACREIEAIGARHGLKVIYDAAHAFGVTDHGVNAGCFGDISMFSFHATKVFHTIEGGCLCCRDPEISRRINTWTHFGVQANDVIDMVGTNAKMTEFAAAMGLCNLRHLDEQIALRKAAALRYRERLGGRKGIVLCPEQEGIGSNYAYMPVQFLPEEFGKSRDQVAEALQSRDISARKYFYPLTSASEVWKTRFPVQETPIAAEVSSRVLCLPLYADLTTEDVDRVCDAVLA